MSIEKFFKKLGYDHFEDDDVKIIKYVCALISVRNALLLSCALSTILERMDKPSATIAVDGSVYKKHPKMHKLMTNFIGQLAPGIKFKMILAEDGSGKGAGLVAAVAMKLRNKL